MAGPAPRCPDGCRFLDAEAAKPPKKSCTRCKTCALLFCILGIFLILVFFGVKYLWSPTPKKGRGERRRKELKLLPFTGSKFYDNTDPLAPLPLYSSIALYGLERTFLSGGEKQKVVMEIDPLARTETFRTGNGSEEILEIHDFKNGITGIFFVGLQKCFIKTQTKVLPETTEAKIPELEGEEITSTYLEQSMVWVPGEKPIQNKEFLKSSKIFDICRNVTIYWIHPTLIAAPELASLGEAEDGAELLVDNQSWLDGGSERGVEKDAPAGPKRRARQLTEEDLPINDYTENGLEFHPLWDERGYCCRQCRRAQRYCRRVCEPLGGYHPYPYCYQGGRVICRLIMPCNWWIARMLGRV